MAVMMVVMMGAKKVVMMDWLKEDLLVVMMVE